MIVVIFVVKMLAKELSQHRSKIDGLISIERVQNLTNEDKFVFLSYWRDRKAVDQWYNKPKYTAAQSEGRVDIFKDYQICVADVFRDYDQSTGRPNVYES